jgi:hypothetical protein
MITHNHESKINLQGDEVDLEAGSLSLLFWFNKNMATRLAPPRLFDPQVYPLWVQSLC